MLDGSFIVATSAIHLITIVPGCLLGLALAKCCKTLIHPSYNLEKIVMTKLTQKLKINKQIIEFVKVMSPKY